MSLPTERQRIESRIAGLRLAGEHGEADELEATLTPRPALQLVKGDDLGDEASDGRHAGADLDAFMAADPALFDAGTYGGRYCQTCGVSIDDARADAATCSSSCRGRRWRRDEAASLDAERHRRNQ